MAGLGLGRRVGEVWRAARGGVLPKAAMLEDFADDGLLVSLDEGDDLHGSAAARAAERVGVIYALDEHGPAAAGEGGRRFEWGARCQSGDWRSRQAAAMTGLGNFWQWSFSAL